MEATLSKHRILEIYLNGIEWGPSLFGIGRAVSSYFQKSVSDLTPGEIAYLTTLIPNPRHYSASFFRKKITPNGRQRLEDLLFKMDYFGFIREEEYENALYEPLSFEKRE